MDNTFLAQFYGKSQNYTDIPNHLYKDYNVKKVYVMKMVQVF